MNKNNQSGQGSSQSQQGSTTGSQQQGSQSEGSQSVKGKFSQQELDGILREGKFTSQSDANSYLQRHGLSCEMKDDGTADIFESQNQQRIAQVQFAGNQSSSPTQARVISGINY